MLRLSLVSFALLPLLGAVFASVVNPLRRDLSVSAKIDLFLAASSYAVVGASDDTSKFGTIVSLSSLWFLPLPHERT